MSLTVFKTGFKVEEPKDRRKSGGEGEGDGDGSFYSLVNGYK